MAAGLHIDSYLNHTFYRDPGLFVWCVLAFSICFYGSCSISTELLIFLCIILIEIITYFITPLFFGQRKIVLTQEKLEEISYSLLGHNRRAFPVNSITDISLRISESDKEKLGAQKYSPLVNALVIILSGNLLYWISGKDQWLILKDENGATTNINLSYYYEQDIKNFVTTLKDICGVRSYASAVTI